MMEACASASGGESSGSEVSLCLYLSPTSQSAGGGNVLVRLRDLQYLWEKGGGGWMHPGCNGC